MKEGRGGRKVERGKGERARRGVFTGREVSVGHLPAPPCVSLTLPITSVTQPRLLIPHRLLPVPLPYSVSPATKAPRYSSYTLSMLQPQCLCTCCSLCTGMLFLRSTWSLPHFIQGQMSSHERGCPLAPHPHQIAHSPFSTHLPNSGFLHV